MKEYFALALTACALVALGGLLLYGDKNSFHARAAMGVILLCTISIPPIKAILSISELDMGGIFEEFEVQGGESAIGQVVGESFSEGIKRMLCEEFELSEDDISVYTFGLDAVNMRAEKIIVVLRGRGALSDLRGIRYSVENAGLGGCEVKIEAS